MSCIGISENGTRLALALKRILASLQRTSVGVKLVQDGGVYDTVLIGTPPPQSFGCFTARTLIVPDCMDASEVSSSLAESVISYGLRSKNTVTASSLIGTRLGISLQRRIPTVSGEACSEQEIIADVKCCEHSDSVLGIVAALLTLDVTPEEISKVKFDF